MTEEKVSNDITYSNCVASSTAMYTIAELQIEVDHRTMSYMILYYLR